VNDGRPEKPGAGEGCPGGGGIPPSAAGQLEPYGARVLLQPASHGLAPQQFLTGLLEDLAASCLASGASVIGHLKCLLYTPSGALACNLTSDGSGARCTARDEGATKVLEPGDCARLDLAVLVYGLPTATIDTLLRGALANLLEPREVAWSINGPGKRPQEAT
jgi:hypothetical protein